MAPADVGRDSATLLVSAALAEAALEAGCGRCKAYVKTARCVRQKDARPGPDLVCSVACAADGDHAAAVALAARRRLADAAGLQLSLAQQPGLLVTTKGHAAKLAEQGLVQCRGCGGFFSHPRGKGLESHQTSASSACREARLEREADDAKRDGKGDEDGDAAGDNAGDGAAVPWSIGSKSSWRDGSGSTAPPLALCLARDGDLDALKKLSGSVKIGRETDRHGSSALLWASGGGHLEIVKWLVGELKVDGQARSKNGRTALHWAARNGHLNVCAYVVQKCNLGVDDKTNDGDTAFMLAAWQGRLDVCKWLVEDCGADAHSVNRWGCNAVVRLDKSFFDATFFLCHRTSTPAAPPAPPFAAGHGAYLGARGEHVGVQRGV